MHSQDKKNQAAFDSCKDQLHKKFGIGTYVAFDDGELIANAQSFDELTAMLAEQGRDRPDVFVVQVAESFPERVFILL
ncbi:MAG: hypothetical protein IT422_28150 [Pirellulaceae bacterium]|jgi:hypothetical protein|nr:hypothetical protein [Pirellulaceae bacterium]